MPINASKRNNANSGRKAHNDNRYIKVGRVRMNSWMSSALSIADIFVSERELVHITNKHSKELNALGLDGLNYVLTIIENCQEVRKDDKTHAYLFALKQSIGNPIVHCAVVEIELSLMNRKKCYIIKTARPESWSRLSCKTLLCAKSRKP